MESGITVRGAASEQSESSTNETHAQTYCMLTFHRSFGSEQPLFPAITVRNFPSSAGAV
jgi:hypothetical protein